MLRFLPLLQTQLGPRRSSEADGFWIICWGLLKSLHGIPELEEAPSEKTLQ